MNSNRTLQHAMHEVMRLQLMYDSYAEGVQHVTIKDFLELCNSVKSLWMRFAAMEAQREEEDIECLKKFGG